MKELKQFLKSEMKRQKENLVPKLRHLATDLNRIADRLDGDDWLKQISLVSDLGEIQARGPMMDVYCAKLKAYESIYSEIDKIEYKLELKLGDRVYISDADKKTLLYPKNLVFEGKLVGFKKDMRCYPPYIAKVKLNTGEVNIIGIGWLKKKVEDV